MTILNREAAKAIIRALCNSRTLPEGGDCLIADRPAIEAALLAAWILSVSAEVNDDRPPARSIDAAVTLAVQALVGGVAPLEGQPIADQTKKLLLEIRRVYESEPNAFAQATTFIATSLNATDRSGRAGLAGIHTAVVSAAMDTRRIP